MSSKKDKIIKKIKHYMVDHDLGVNDLAELTGISRQAIWNNLNDKTKEIAQELLNLINNKGE